MNVAEGETIYFLDTSALAKLYHQEQGSEMVEGWAADRTIRLWLSDLARVELHSVFVRKIREGELAEATLQTVLECFREDLHSRFHLVLLTEDIIEQAIAVLLDHGKRRPLRTLDALQIASAKAVGSSDLTFVTADRQLFTAASALFPYTINPEVESEHHQET
jgi:Predicted nucleic acid-binding protein, contains PIN domain